MTRSLLVVAFLALSAAPSYAQHPCDAAVPANPQIAAPVAFGFCHNGKDPNGQPVVITAFVVTVGGQEVFKGPLNAVGAANAQGFYYFETPKTIVLAKGTQTALVVAQSSDGSSLPSVPFAFGVLGLPPSQVLKVRSVGSPGQ